MKVEFTSANDYTFGSEVPHTISYLNPAVLKECRRIAEKGRQVLDLGCGNGYLCRDLAAAGFKTVGIDTSESGVREARRLVPTAKFYHLGVYSDPELVAESAFDAVVSTEVIEHLFYPRELVRFARKKLRVGGHLIISTPYHGYLKNVLIALTNKWDFHHTPLWDGGHIKFWSRTSLAMLLEEQGFRIVGFRGCGRVPFLWKSMLMIAVKEEDVLC